ncbi:hypothetical protein G7Y79_00001g004150 [Physcia stellaris]|nr:hypothetical protein G7Y79_00001g004150 [Physcia stellaris]
MTKAYQYEQLPDQHVRLLTLLHPGQFEREIRLSLACVLLDIDRPPSYHALSYVWGDTDRIKSIIVELGEEDYIHKVTDNLYTALKYLRSTDQVRTLWIDAICIHQENAEERSAQVARMADIYRSASKVIIWLGPAGDNSDIAMKTLSSISSRINVQWATHAIEVSDTNDMSSDLKPLQMTKYALCSDQRDRIYGIVHLIDKASRPDIRLDYTKSTVDVFRDLMLTMVITHKELSLLTSCGLSDLSTDMPSWVPNFSKPIGNRDILTPRACWNSSAQARYTNGGPLTVCGCRAATIKQQVNILKDDDPFPLPYKNIWVALRTLLCIMWEKPYVDFDRQNDKICRTLCCNEFAECYEPKSSNLVDCRQTIEHFNDCAKSTDEVSDDFLDPYRRTLDLFYASVFNRAFVFTEEGYIGLTPKKARPNDIIVTLLGCQSSIVLRPTDKGTYIVVGSCYVHDIITGDLLLGPLPKNWQRVWRYDEQTQNYWDAFVDRENGMWQIDDPRLGALPDGWSKEDHPLQHVYHVFRDDSTGSKSSSDPRMLPESLRARGVDIREFQLV